MSESLRVSGKKVKLPAAAGDWSFSPRPGGWIVAENAATGERRRLALHEARGQLGVSLGGMLWQGSVVSDRAGPGGSGASEADLKAQFPGKVRKVLVAAGARVAEGDPLVLVEAMKMEFAVKAPFAGVIRAVLVKEGQQLSPGDAFVDLEAAKT